MDSVWRTASSRDFGKMEAAMNIRLSAHLDHGSRRNIASTSAALAKIPGKPVDQEFDRCSRSDSTAFRTKRSGRRLAVCRRVALGFCTLSLFLLGGLQSFAAPVEVTNFGTNPG